MVRLVIRNVGKAFALSRGKGVVHALKDMSFEVGQGEFLSILGPSGCGKSTLLRIIAGLERQTSGAALFDGEPIEGPSWRRGMVFQEYALPPWKTVSQNIAWGPKFRGAPKQERERAVRRYVEIVGLKGFEDRFPYELSGGMKQRCALARTLANDPDILLMDEPFAAVDAQTREILQEELLRIWGEAAPQPQRKTVILVTHSIEEAVFLSDRILVMTARPGIVKGIIVNPLKRPRAHEVKTSGMFIEAREYLWQLVKEETLKAIRQGF